MNVFLLTYRFRSNQRSKTRSERRLPEMTKKETKVPGVSKKSFLAIVQNLDTSQAGCLSQCEAPTHTHTHMYTCTRTHTHTCKQPLQAAEQTLTFNQPLL